jgi:hypothetical protein
MNRKGRAYITRRGLPGGEVKKKMKKGLTSPWYHGIIRIEKGTKED